MATKKPIVTVGLRHYASGEWEVYTRRENEEDYKFYDVGFYGSQRLARIVYNLVLWGDFFLTPLAVGWVAYRQGVAPNIPKAVRDERGGLLEWLDGSWANIDALREVVTDENDS